MGRGTSSKTLKINNCHSAEASAIKFVVRGALALIYGLGLTFSEAAIAGSGCQRYTDELSLVFVGKDLLPAVYGSIDSAHATFLFDTGSAS